MVHDALRNLEERKSKLEALRTHLAEGARQAKADEFVDDFSLEGVIDELDERT